MTPVLASNKSCTLKGVQKVFYFTTGDVASCCRAFPEKLSNYHSLDQLTSVWQQEQVEMARGHEVPSCEPCWRLERENLQSLRQRWSSTWDLASVEISTSNLCNQMCSYCSPRYSSEWQNSIQQHGMFKNISKSAKTNLAVDFDTVPTDQWLDQIGEYIQQQADDSVVIKLLGGEPLMQQRNLQNLLSLNSNKINQIKIATNLNPPSNKFLIWLLDHCPIKKLDIEISLDTTPECNHLPRAGFDQHRFMHNLELIQKHGVTPNVSSVLSVLGVFDHANFIVWLHQQQLQTRFIRLNNPDCLDIVHVPHEFLCEIVANSQHPPDQYVQELVDKPQPQVDLKLFEQYNYLKQYFLRTNTEVNGTVFEPYWNWLKERYENSISI